MIDELQIATAQVTDLANGFLGVQIDGHGDDAAVATFQLHHAFGFISRPRDPDAKGNGCSVLYGYEGDRGHAWVLGDPRYTPSVPATKKGGSTQYAITSTGAVSYAAFDGDDGSYLLETAGSADVRLGGPSAEFVALASLVASELAAIADAFSKLTSATGGPVSFVPPYLGYFPSSVAATKVKAV